MAVAVTIDYVAPEFNLGTGNLTLGAVESELVLAIAPEDGAEVADVVLVVFAEDRGIVEVGNTNQEQADEDNSQDQVVIPRWGVE